MQTVTSNDRTKIAYDSVGQGPTLILVNGALKVKTLARLLAAFFAPSPSGAEQPAVHDQAAA
jgi:hypothetical protein